MSKVTIDLCDNDPNELALVADMIMALANYRAGADDPALHEAGETLQEAAACIFGGEPDGEVPIEHIEPDGEVPAQQPTPTPRRRRKKSGLVNPADLDPSKEPPLPLTATAAGTQLSNDAQAVAAAVTGGIVLLDSSGTPKASYATLELAANALIEILKAAPSKDSLDNLLTVNSSTLGRLGKEGDRVIEAYGDLTAKLKTAAAPVVAPQPVELHRLDKLLEEIGDSTKPSSPAAAAPAPAIVGPMPEGDKLVQACGDLLQVYARDKGAGFVGALNLLTKEFGVDNIKKIAADKLPTLYTRLAELVQAP